MTAFRALTLLSLFFWAPLTAQNIQGIIVDSDQVPLSEVLVFNARNGSHTHSNGQGRFQLSETETGDSIQLVMLGYETTWMIIKQEKDDIKVVLEARTFSLNEVVILPRINALHLMADMDIQMNPVQSSQDILRLVPGLVIGQHAGGGKAEQMFLRGFDLDHGTDILITADGMPVNMVSHAHGHGYADLHFLIPETVDRIDFGKGPYYGDKGNLNTAGYVDFSTKSALENSVVKLEVGQFQTKRVLGMFDLAHSNRHKAYVATEYLSTDGPFESPQDFKRINIMGKYTGQISSQDKVSILASHFTSRWDASGQIPQRKIDDGSISRFGAIDDTEGGETARTNVLISTNHVLQDQLLINTSAYYSRYIFELFSNFTFFLNDPVNGDQIRQKESRDIFGLSSHLDYAFNINGIDGLFKAGISLRHDDSQGNELSHTANRKVTLEQRRKGDIRETAIGMFIHPEIHLVKWTVLPGIRLDAFDFTYVNALSNAYDRQSVNKWVVSPKFNLLYNANTNLQFYLKTGKGFHSNDTRVVIAQNGRQAAPAAWGSDLGLIWKPRQSLMVNGALWHLDLDQEFVYVGDEGVVEPSGKTRRKGVDLSIRHQPLPWLYTFLDASYAHARSRTGSNGENFIPLAPEMVLGGGMSVQFPSGFYGGFKIRHINDRPANEDASLTALGYTVIDAHLGASWRNLDIGCQIQNLFNSAWNETQFATTSRLMDEPNEIEEIHLTPGTPFFIKAVLSYSF